MKAGEMCKTTFISLLKRTSDSNRFFGEKSKHFGRGIWTPISFYSTTYLTKPHAANLVDWLEIRLYLPYHNHGFLGPPPHGVIEFTRISPDAIPICVHVFLECSCILVFYAQMPPFQSNVSDRRLPRRARTTMGQPRKCPLVRGPMGENRKYLIYQHF